MTPTSVELSLRDRVFRVREAVALAAERASRRPEDVVIVAVSKTVDRATVDVAYALGLRHFGENRVQDAAAKFAEPLPADAALHMIGQLQTNKAAVAARLFGMLESVDRPSLIAELDRQGAKLGRIVPVLLQVNVAGEAQKAGCDPAAAAGLASRIEQSPYLRLHGLMTIAPLVADPDLTRPIFRGLRELRDRLSEERPGRRLSILSMGMSDDYQIAIEEGATQIRIGRAIFGP